MDTDIDAPPPDGDHEDAEDDSILDGLIGAELGATMAATLRRARRAQEARFRDEHPDEGLRERKRRLTRQLISDAATWLFATRGFDEVRVSEVAERVGVSEKTIYNYFPTKESMVLDTADEMVESLAVALRDRAPGESITDAVLRTLEADLAQFDTDTTALDELVPAFVAMVEQTPSLHAAWLEVHARLTRVATDELAAQAGVDPRDPEPTIAGRALVGLVEVGMQSRMRRTQDGLRGAELRAAVTGDVRRAARLLETGLWSFNLPTSARARSQAMEAARAAEEARRQVVGALREARIAWADARREAREAHDDARRAVRSAAEEAHSATARARREQADDRHEPADARHEPADARHEPADARRDLSDPPRTQPEERRRHR